MDFPFEQNFEECLMKFEISSCLPRPMFVDYVKHVNNAGFDDAEKKFT